MEWWIWITRWIIFCIDIQDYFEYILEKDGEDIDKPLVQIYVNKNENRVTFKIKNGYSIEHLTPETMKLPGGTKKKYLKKKAVKMYLILKLQR